MNWVSMAVRAGVEVGKRIALPSAPTNYFPECDLGQFSMCVKFRNDE